MYEKLQGGQCDGRGVSEQRGQETGHRGNRVGEEVGHIGPGDHRKDWAFALTELGTKGGF